jgi:hypothetical protein
MYARLYALWFVDHQTRMRVYIASVLVGFAYGLFNNLILVRPEGRVTWEALGLLCVMVLGFTVAYCTQKEQTGIKESPFGKRWLVMVAAGATAVGILSLFTPGGMPPSFLPKTEQLTKIRTTIQTAETQRVVLPPSQITTYKKAVRATSPSSAADYWPTVAAIINYQSYINQLNGKAPDPATVAKPCDPTFYTPGGRFSYNNDYEGLNFSNCIVDLDTNIFKNVTFQNSVVRYRGGPISLVNVEFLNCHFDLMLSKGPAKPTEQQLLFTLLDSDQQNVRMP